MPHRIIVDPDQRKIEVLNESMFACAPFNKVADYKNAKRFNPNPVRLVLGRTLPDAIAKASN